MTQTRQASETRTPRPGARGRSGLERPWTRARRLVTVRRSVTVLAGVLVWLALLLPVTSPGGAPSTGLAVPVEILIVVVPARVLARRTRVVVALTVGGLFGVLTVLGLLDVAFEIVLDRPLDPVADWSLLGSGEDFLTATYGRVLALGISLLAVVAVLGVVIVVTACVLRLTGAVSRYRRGGVAAALVIALVWVTCSALGVRGSSNVPVAASDEVHRVSSLVQRIRTGVSSEEEFRTQLAVDRYAGVAPGRLLSGLRGKDVILVFVESYGRSALQDPGLDSGVLSVLGTASQRLQSDGFGARSAWLTSPTFGGGSWLAHSTLQSGTWVSDQTRYVTLVNSHRLTLTRAFREAGWRTVAVMPATQRPWPEGAFYDYTATYLFARLGYRGPSIGWGTMPDQYVLSALQRLELQKPHPPLMAEVELVSSHAPWARIPALVPWQSLGDGSEFARLPVTKTGASLADRNRTRAGYAQSIEYSLSALLDFVHRAATPQTVVVFLGDHQPATTVTGFGVSHDVPITVVSKDPAVLDGIGGWGWTPGLVPAPGAPRWPMDAFRDRFLSAFTPGPSTAGPSPATGP